jgi:hypothetical protein
MGKATGIPVIPKIAFILTPYPNSTTADWQTGESIVTVIGAIGIINLVHSLLLDISALAGNVAIRLYTNINGVVRQIYPQPITQTFSVAIDGPGLPIVNGIWAINGLLIVTAQSNAVADNGQPIGWEYILGGT